MAYHLPYDLLLNLCCLAGQSVMHLGFAARLAGIRPKAWHFLCYGSLLFPIDLSFSKLLPCSTLPPIAAGALALYAMCRRALGSRPPLACLAAILAFFISQLSFGLINSAEAVLLPRLVGKPLLYWVLAAALALFFALCSCCYAAVERLLAWAKEGETPYLVVLLLPVLFCFAAELYLLNTAYASISPSLSPGQMGKHGALLLLQGMGLGATLCTLYAYRQLCRGFRAQAALESLTQAAQAQKIYIAEAQARYEQTRAFRHDVKNHLSLLDGLLSSGRVEEGRAYLSKLEAASGSLSFPYQTGSPVVDILLAEKLGLAKEIPAEVSLLLPSPWGVDDLDLCILFANALDNAIAACRSAQGEAFIRISGKRQGDFYLLTFTNACSGSGLPSPGTGLANIRAVAEKYQGAMETELAGRQFSLRVLLNAAST